jgi:hypothetical protein
MAAAGLAAGIGSEEPSGRSGIAAGYGVSDPRPALDRIESPIALDLGNLCDEVVIFDLLAEPTRIITGVQMMQPGPVVDAVSDLQEQVQVLGAQVEAVSGPRK